MYLSPLFSLGLEPTLEPGGEPFLYPKIGSAEQLGTGNAKSEVRLLLTLEEDMGEIAVTVKEYSYTCVGVAIFELDFEGLTKVVGMLNVDHRGYLSSL